ncbi:MAG: imelysin family protein [Panacagrimonas sp.]
MTQQHIKLWTRVGGFSCLAISSVAAAEAPQRDGSSAGSWMVAQGGEGGEAGEAPSSYRLLSSDPKVYAFDVRAQVQHYARLVHASYRESATRAAQMQQSIQALLRQPSAQSLATARESWVAARPAYLVTEVFRFYDGPIDITADGAPGPESRINAWPLNEAYIDAVRGQPRSGIVWDTQLPLTRESILSRDQVSDEADVTTGWHAIEFLLWGQDFNAAGPGDRPFTDYVAGKPDTDRRRLYLATVTEMLVADLRALEAAWAPDADNYRRRFVELEPREALGRAVNGMANLAAHELATERLSVALDSGDQEDEHSCFSDTTHQDHLYDLRGIHNVWLGGAGPEPHADSLSALLHKLDPAMAARTDDLFAQALAAVATMDPPFDSILRSPADSPQRQRAEAAVSAFQALGAQLARVGQRLGVLVIVPGLAPIPT